GTSSESWGTPAQISLANTLCPAGVPMLLLPASTRPRPSTLIRPSVLTSALRREITHGVPAGWTPCTTLGTPPARNGWTPMPSSKRARGSAALAPRDVRVARDSRSAERGLFILISWKVVEMSWVPKPLHYPQHPYWPHFSGQLFCIALVSRAVARGFSNIDRRPLQAGTSHEPGNVS